MGSGRDEPRSGTTTVRGRRHDDDDRLRNGGGRSLSVLDGLGSDQVVSRLLEILVGNEEMELRVRCQRCEGDESVTCT
jgi:hypothetical protein